MFKQKTPDNSHADPHDGSGNSMQLAQAAHQRYLLRSSSEDLTTAINFYIEALKNNPDTPNAYFRLASLLHENGQIGIESAIEQCKKAVGIDPENPNAHMYLGYFLSLHGDFDEAKEHFKTAIKLKPLTSSRTRLVLALPYLVADSAYEDLPGGLRIPEIHPVINRPFIVYGGLPVFFQESPQFLS